MYAYYVEGWILIIHVAIKVSNSMFSQERLLDDGMSRAGDFKSGSAFIQGFFHIRATHTFGCVHVRCVSKHIYIYCHTCTGMTSLYTSRTITASQDLK